MEFAMPKRKEYADYMQKFAVAPQPLNQECFLFVPNILDSVLQFRHFDWQ